MTQWNIARKKYIRKEKIYLCLGFICLIIGIISDILVRQGIVFLEVDSLVDYSMVLIQVQASIGTLTFAIIALIGGNISDSYMGVSVSDYYLNIKPYIFKQKRIIFASLILILANSICHLLALYNMVIYVFVITFILIGISINGVYSIFEGKHKTQEEIEKYYKYIMQENGDYQKALELCYAFIGDWKEIAKMQNKEEFEKYKKLFLAGIESLIEDRSCQSIKDINKLSYEASNFLLSGISGNEKLYGIMLVQEVYHFLWQYISNDKNKDLQFEESITLFMNIEHEFINAMDSLPAEKVEKVAIYDLFIESILRVIYGIAYDENNSKIEIGCINHLAGHIGCYLSRQYQKGNEVNKKYWGNLLRSNFCSYSKDIPEGLIEDYVNSKCSIQFNYCYGLLISGVADIVKENLYYTDMANLYYLTKKQHAVLILSIHCFLYYLGYRESETCVSAEIRNVAQEILDDSQVKKIFSSFLYRLSEHRDWLDDELEQAILDLIEKHELFPKYSNSKTLISSAVVKDFFLFIILYLSHEYYLPELVDYALEEEKYIRYAYEMNNDNTRKLLIKLYSLIDAHNKNEADIKNNVDLMFNTLERRLKSKYKDSLIQKARESQKKYEETVNVREICAKIKKNIIDRFNKKFNSILIDKDENNQISEVKVFTLVTYTEDISGEFPQNFYPNVFGNFVSYLIWYLEENDFVDIRKRKEDFSDDRDFMRYLQDNELTLLIGSKYALSNMDYNFTNEFNEFTEDYDCIYTTLVGDGLALQEDSVKICLHDVNVTVRPARIQDTDAKEKKDTGQYIYAAVIDKEVEFEANEIKDFIHNVHKIIEITIKISVQINGRCIGTLITDREI